MKSNTKTLWNRNFTLLWLGSAQSRVGTALYIVALTYLVLDLTGNAKYTAITLAVAAIPYLFSPLAGALVDRLDMKKYLVVGDILRGVGMLVICLLGWYDHLSITVIYGVSFSLGVVGVIYAPAFGSLLPRLVPKTEVGRANALNNMNAEIAILFGFAVGGIFVAWLGTLTAIFINSLSFFIMSIFLGMIHFPIREQKTKNNTGIWIDIRQGFTYLLSSKMLLMVPIIFGLTKIAYTPLEALMPLKMKQLEAGSKEFGIFFALITVGSLLISTYVSKYGKSLNPTRYTTFGLFIMGLAIYGTAISSTIIIVYISAICFGVGSSLVGISNMTYVQTEVDDEYRGRVFGSFGVIEQAGLPASLALIGILIEAVNLETILYALAGLLFVTLVIWNIMSRKATEESRTINQAATKNE
ncbi:Transmembrane secretion effector [Marininema mesophilum]|uniref:Transmembrane secretion effector n=1 Tax=Marininema mesophilum TaxID=1048340 RepID=A0A1H2PXW7_9BACL|nr:MFS transporter [Marininema mesophilum]SDV99710.1 Transmembrane secretion effector [Marininema mesophilum]